MPNRTISLIPQYGPASITAIDCGSSSPKLSGILDVSAFPNLTGISCVSNGITKFQGYGPLTNLVDIRMSDNAFGAAQGNFETLSNKPNLKTLDFSALVSQQFINWTGEFPDLTQNTKLEDIRIGNTSLTGSNLNFSMLPELRLLGVQYNQLSGAFPLLPTGLNSKITSVNFSNGRNNVRYTNTSAPSLDSNTLPLCINLIYAYNNVSGNIQSIPARMNSFWCDGNLHTGSIPSLTAATQLTQFICSNQRNPIKLTGNIPDLSANSILRTFRCDINQLSGFAGGSVSATLGEFRAENNQLTSTAVDAILAAFVTANRTSGTRILSLGGTGNAVPTSTGVTKTTLAGTAFSRSGTTVTVNSTAHGYVTGDWVTITGITETAFQGTFSITRINDNTFQYTTVSSGTLTGSGTATLRKTSTDNTSGFRNYQALALVSRTGGPWTITINFPA